MPVLRVGPPEFSPALVVFDKDGTLIDFHHMWAQWITTLARRLNTAAGRDLSFDLYRAMGYDVASARVLPGTPLAVHSMAALRRLTQEVARSAGLSSDQAAQVVATAWYLPDPVVLARPVADVRRVFETLARAHIKIAVATSDDRAPAQATLEALGAWRYVNALVAADDGLPNKPAPDMLLRLYEMLGVSATQTVMVGDSVADLEMARAAHVRLAIGVASGVSPAALLAPYADAVIPSIDDLV